MRSLYILLAASLAGNVALYALGYRLRSESRSEYGAVTAHEGTANATGATAAGQTVSHSTSADAAVAHAATWNQLRGADLKSLFGHLHEAGFPPKLATAIIVALVTEKYRLLEIQELHGTDAPNEYWKPSSGQSITVTRKNQEILEGIWAERRRVLADVLGPDWEARDEASAVSLKRQYGDLPTEKLAGILAIMEKNYDARRKVGPAGAMPLPEDGAKLDAIEQATQSEIAQLLTPAEREAYDLRTGEAANYVRFTVRDFTPTESEYRALAALYRPFVEQYKRPYYLGPAPAEWQAERADAEKQLQPAIAATLGAERYADFQQATDEKYNSLNRVVSRLALPISAARDVVAVQTEIDARVAAVRSNRELASAERERQLASLADEAQARIAAKLGGERGFNAYQENAGTWLQSLKAKPPGSR